ncbi:thioesterase [Pseudoxanthomonas broegbernensis]|uniref:Thioesterase n=1 Tax=Pseudoxanthomonas broegbernensis TaxID=83619 RepID=A0A7V8K7J8_9GAMM|nr:YiiD C-terminal domain-containing protein [Pseudoxanthomonas broegbernensis]KAF1686977.1 thioesterase [Pseudoxanthomonas broegbernensis]MBB6065412.1 thioesterase domain-containing protein [Pseudoxanthomonas broegbernensis]
MTTDDSLERLKAHLRAIPLVRAMQVELAGAADGRLRLRAPLAPNVNDKGSAFGGSLVSLMTLAGWGLATRQLARAGMRADVYVADSTVRYLAPLHAGLEAEAWLEEGGWDAFVATFGARGRARCRIAARVLLPDGGDATVFSGRFVALAREAQAPC